MFREIYLSGSAGLHYTDRVVSCSLNCRIALPTANILEIEDFFLI